MKGNDAGVASTDSIEFIAFDKVPSAKKVTYANFVYDYCPLKMKFFCIRLVFGCDKLDYIHDAGSPTTNLLETKLLINSVISDAHKGARFLSADLKDFFLLPQWTNQNICVFISSISLQTSSNHTMLTILSIMSMCIAKSEKVFMV